VVGGSTVCTTLGDTTKIFYDDTGQGDQLPIGFAFSGGTSPVEVDTVTSAIGLQSTGVAGAVRRSNFLALVERLRLERIHRAALHLSTLRFERSHR